MRFLSPVFLTLSILLLAALAQAQSDAGAAAKAAFDAGDFSKAVSLLKKLVKADPSDAGAWNSLAAAYLHLNEAGKAEAASAEAIKAEPKNAEYWGTYGFALAAAEKDDNARSAAVKASELDPKLAVPYYVQALVSFRAGDHAKSFGLNEKAIAADPNFAAPHLLKARLYIAHLAQIYDKEVDRDRTKGQRSKILSDAAAALARFDSLTPGHTSDSKMSAPLTVLNFFVEYYKWLAQKDQDGQNASSLKGSASWATVVNLIPPGYKEKMREPKDVVRLLVYLGADGKVGPILVLKGLPNGLTEKAIENLQQLKFTPARKNGVPINVVRIVEYTVTAL